MAETSFGERLGQYRPTKTIWFWSTAACIVLTIILGFTWGGWVTGGAAADRAETAASEAVANLAADICANRFLAASDAAAQLGALKEASSYQRDDFIADGGWVTFANAKEPVDGAAELCAERLAEVELPATATAVAKEASVN